MIEFHLLPTEYQNYTLKNITKQVIMQKVKWVSKWETPAKQRIKCEEKKKTIVISEILKNNVEIQGFIKDFMKNIANIEDLVEIRCKPSISEICSEIWI